MWHAGIPAGLTTMQMLSSSFTTDDAAARLACSDRSARRVLLEAVRSGVLDRTGTGTGTRYRFKRAG